MTYSDPWVLPSSLSRHTGETVDRLAQQQDDIRWWTLGLVSPDYRFAVEDLIAQSSNYGVGGRQS